MSAEDALPAHPCWQMGIRDLDHTWAFLAWFSQVKSWPWCSSPSRGVWTGMGAQAREVHPAAPAATPRAAPSRSASRQGTAGSRRAPGSLLLLGDAGGTVPITFPSRSRFMSLPKALLQPSRKAGAGGWREGGVVFAGNCESTFLHGCVPLCNGNPLSRVKRRPSYHDLLCRFPWIPCTINKKRNFKPVFNPA